MPQRVEKMVRLKTDLFRQPERLPENKIPVKLKQLYISSITYFTYAGIGIGQVIAQFNRAFINRTIMAHP